MLVQGFRRLFWTDLWVISIFLNKRLPRLFTIRDYLEGGVGEVERWKVETLIWDFRWMRHFFVHKELVLAEFLAAIRGHTFSVNIDK